MLAVQSATTVFRRRLSQLPRSTEVLKIPQYLVMSHSVSRVFDNDLLDGTEITLTEGHGDGLSFSVDGVPDKFGDALYRLGRPRQAIKLVRVDLDGESAGHRYGFIAEGCDVPDGLWV